MSSIGKIFVIVNLVLALLVVGSMGALLNASRATRDDVTRLETALAEKEAQLAQGESDFATRKRQLEAEKQTLQSEVQDLKVERDNAQRNADRQTTDNQQLRDDFTKLTASVGLLQQDLSAKEQRNGELQATSDDLRTQALDAQEQARQAEIARRDLAEQIAGFESQVEQLDGELTAALDRARQAERLLEVAQGAGFNPHSILATPAIDALVAQVDTDYDFVILDKGKADNVEKGFVFDVYRGGDYLGQVRVDQVHESHSTAKIVLERSPMRAHDRATTRL
jgi:Tfp pilus assembly protein PilX